MHRERYHRKPNSDVFKTTYEMSLKEFDNGELLLALWENSGDTIWMLVLTDGEQDVSIPISDRGAGFYMRLFN